MRRLDYSGPTGGPLSAYDVTRAALCEVDRPDLALQIKPNRGGDPCIGRSVYEIRAMSDDELRLVFRAAQLGRAVADPLCYYPVASPDEYVSWVRSYDPS